MYRVSVNITVRIEGCPTNGIEAVEFRRKHGITESPCDTVTLKYSEENGREICEEHRDLLNASADLILYNADIEVKTRTIELAPDAILAYQQSGDISILLRHVKNARKAMMDKLDAEAAQAAADRVLARENAIRELLAMDADQLASDVLCGPDFQTKSNHRFRELLAVYDAPHGRGFPEARYTHPDCEGLMGLIQIARNLAVAKAREAAQEKVRPMLEWIGQHGSERLKKSAEELGPTSAVQELYLEERIAVERPGWVWYGDIEETTDSDLGKCPQTEDFEMLAKAREFEPDAQLQMLHGEEDYLVAEATYLGGTIIYGYRAE